MQLVSFLLLITSVQMDGACAPAVDAKRAEAAKAARAIR
jgi:hypothetical protein